MMGRLSALLLLMTASTGVSGTVVTVWVDDSQVFRGSVFDEVSIRLAGLAKCFGKREPSNYCRHSSCTFQYVQIPLTPDFQLNETGMRVSHEESDVLLVSVRILRDLIHKGRKNLARALLPAERKRALRVLYWREDVWGRGVTEDLQRDMIDLNMGAHFTSSILNPSFFPFYEFETPDIASRPFSERPMGAFYITSDCGAQPRTDYLASLKRHGLDVDEYGMCANRPLGRSGGKSVGQAETASKYKFYLSFENTIGEGYVSEKLLVSPSQVGAVPVYLGAPNAHLLPHIDQDTDRPWFVDVRDFDTPKDLARFLSSMNETTWNSYARRNHTFPSALESISFARNRSMVEATVDLEKVLACPVINKAPLIPDRVAATCRLCDLDFLRRSAAHFVPIAPPVTQFKCLFKSGCACDDFRGRCQHADY